MIKIKQILLGAIVIGQTCSALHAVDSEDLKQYGKIGVSVASVLLGLQAGRVAYEKHCLLQDPKLLKDIPASSSFKDILKEYGKNSHVAQTTKERNIAGGVAAALIAGGAYGLSQSLK